MPFTERELRAMLEDNSADVPPTHDLAATAEAGGRRARRRRYVAGGAATAAAIALGFTFIPGLFAADGSPGRTDRSPALAATVSPTTAVRPDVDLSLLKEEGPLLSALGSTTKNLEDLRRRGSWTKGAGNTEVLINDADGRILVGAFMNSHVVAGTVVGFSALPGDPKTRLPEGQSEVGLTLRVDRLLTDEPGFEKSPAGEITIVLGGVTGAGLDRLKAAIPAGARTVAYLGEFATPRKNADTPLYVSDNLIFEDADGSLTRGDRAVPKAPVQESTGPVSTAKSFDELLDRIVEGEKACKAAQLPGNKRLGTKELKALAKDRAHLQCLRLQYTAVPPVDSPTAWPSTTP